jgi:hypothetical protein
LGG